MPPARKDGGHPVYPREAAMSKNKAVFVTLRPGETIHVREGIFVVVCGKTPRRVSLGIEAPPDVTILRKELLQGGQADAEPTGYAGGPGSNGSNGNGHRRGGGGKRRA